MKALLSTVILLLMSAMMVRAGGLVVGVSELCKPGAISASHTYIQALMRGGHIPVVLPTPADSTMARQMLEWCDVLFLMGGEDVNPARYAAEPSPLLSTVNNRRDSTEWMLLDAAVALGKPIMGICRGMQMINVFFGGTLYQDLPTEYPAAHAEDRPAAFADSALVIHRPEDKSYAPIHTIVIEPDSRLRQVVECDTMQVNSMHHQAVKQLAPGFKVAARAVDGVVEAIESQEGPVFGVQFHPERLAVGDDKLFTRLFAEIQRLTHAE